MQVAKWIVAAVALMNFGGYLMDAVLPFTARQHLYNPRWPPHAKLHNCQTMVLGMGLGLLSLFVLFGVHPLTLPLFLLAAALAGLYFVSLLLAALFPGTAWTDPDFLAETKLPFGMHAQKLIGLVICGLLLIACVLAWRSE